MRLKIFFCALLLAGCMLPASAQKVGFADLEVILAYMPETKTANEKMQKKQSELTARLKVKDDYFQTKLQEAQAAQAGGASEEDLKKLGEELQKLQAELQSDQAKAEQELARVRQQEMGPAIEKLDKAIKGLAADEGYDMILNSTASGVTIVLHGPEEHNLTKKLFGKLGIPLPEGAN